MRYEMKQGYCGSCLVTVILELLAVLILILCIHSYILFLLSHY